MKEAKGAFTVEAAILLPCLLLAAVVLIYLLVFVYDRVLMVQDVNVLADCAYNSQLFGADSDEIVDLTYKTICEEHPYLAIGKLTLIYEKRGGEVIVGLSGNWNVPVYSILNREMKYERKVKAVSPVYVMRTASNIERLISEEIECSQNLNTN